MPFLSIERRIERFSGWLIVPRNWQAGLQLQPDASGAVKAIAAITQRDKLIGKAHGG
jgi:hypothetical protein